jgi:hypothetical protein
MKNHIFILLFLLGFLSNNTAFAVANKAIVSEKQTINNIPKYKKVSYLEKVFNKKIEKIVKNKIEVKEIISKVVRFICAISMMGLLAGLVALIILGLFAIIKFMIYGVFVVISIDLILLIMGILGITTILTAFIIMILGTNSSSSC